MLIFLFAKAQKSSLTKYLQLYQNIFVNHIYAIFN